MLDAVEKHLRDRSPGFRCYASGDDSENLAYLAHVVNRLERPAKLRSLADFGWLVGDVPPTMRRFWELHDGLVLYCDMKSDAAGIQFYPAEEWEFRTAEMHESMLAMGLDESDMPEWFQTGVVFGEIPNSANYFVFQTHGDAAGHVYYADHDDFSEEPIADSFDTFLNTIVSDSASFMYDRGCYTRYSDGKTKTQWIPKAYLSDCSGD